MNAVDSSLKFLRAHDGAAEQFRSGSVWSLWDMFEFNAVGFYKATTAINKSRLAIEARKDEFVVNNDDGSMTIKFIDDETLINIILERTDELRKIVFDMGLSITLMAIDDHIKTLHAGHIFYGDLLNEYIDIGNSLKRELSSVKMFSISKENLKYYFPISPLFGAEFTRGFDEFGAFELDEAAKCLALGRSTAAVFHLMRCMECGLVAISRCLGIPDPIKPIDRTWGKMMDVIWGVITSKWDSADRLHGDGELFDDLYASMDAMKNPWRDATMHVQKKYTHEEAEHIFASVRGFMMKLSARCDERGIPLA